MTRYQIVHLLTVDSTNTYLKSMVEAPEWTCVTADQQTAGRGRQGREWHSAPGDGLYLSILLRPTSAFRKLTELSLIAAIAVAETLIDLFGVGIAESGGKVDIKWPNDLLVDGRKISGILVESAGLANGESVRVVVGIGVNLNQTQFPAPLDTTATSCRLVSGQIVDHDSFRDQLLDRFWHWYQHWLAGDSGMILSRWCELSSYASGRPVSVELDGQILTGITAGLDDHGALLLRTVDGGLRTIIAGEVHGLRAGSSIT